MQREILLLTEMIDAAQEAQQLTAGITVSQLETDRQRRDALLWNFTVLGEAAGQRDDRPSPPVPSRSAVRWPTRRSLASSMAFRCTRRSRAWCGAWWPTGRR